MNKKEILGIFQNPGNAYRGKPFWSWNGELEKGELLRQMDEAMERYGENYTDLQIGGLGLVNTITRLRLLTEDRVSCSIDPGDPQGTIVTLKGTWKG